MKRYRVILQKLNGKLYDADMVEYENGEWVKYQETKWTEQDDGAFWECDNCKLGWFFDSGSPEDNDTNYCPKCGFRIVGYTKEVE